MIKRILIISMTLVTFLSANDDKYFVGVSIGASKLSVSQNDKVGSISLGTQPDTEGVNANIEIGYKHNMEFFSTLSYSQVKYSEVKLHNYLISYNKTFNKSSYKPYIGVVAGISYIELRKSLINGNTIDKEGKKSVIGVQTGFEKELNDHLVFFSQYQFLKAKHSTSVESNSAKSELIRDNYSNISLGLRLSF